MKKTTARLQVARLLAAAALGCAVQHAAAASLTIASSPLATAGGSGVLPNLLFVLDSSGSMDWDYNGDFVNDSNKCMLTSSSSTTCTYGDPPFSAGGANAMNGVAYDPMFNYKPALNSNGTTVLASPLTVTAVPNDAYGAQATGTTNLTTSVPQARYCNANNVCKRNGVDTTGTVLVSGSDYLGRTMSAGRFPYRTHGSNASTQVFGLPEMMLRGSFTGNGTTVTATTITPHGLANNDWIYVTGSGATNAVQVTVTNANVFTYPSGSSFGATTSAFRKHDAGSFTRAGTLVTVTATAHGLQTGDIILVNATGLNETGRTITVVDANSFTYTSATSGAVAATAGTWIRTGLYNVRGTFNGTAYSYYITPIEYCSDVNLTDCVEVIPPATPPAGFPFPAYVRYCRTQEQALSPGLVSDSAGTPRCRSKFIGSGATQWIYPRFGWFNRDVIQATTATYARGANRSDCAGAPSCTYTEEIQNYARWWTYYRTRMQMMKTAAGRAFLPFVSNPSATPAIPDKLRVGFITINPNYANGGSSDLGSVQASRYLKIDNFNTTQASSWYTKFYAQIPNQSTPLREALSRAGWIYSGKLNTGLTAGIPLADDPVQVACQRHFTLLTTDGYWNGSGGQDITGGAIGNADNQNPTTDSPYTQVSVDRSSTVTFDGGRGTVVRTDTPSTTTEQVVCVANNNTTFSGGGTQTTCGCTAGQHRIKQRVATTTTTSITTDGVLNPGSPTTSSSYAFSNVTACSAALVVTTTTPANRLEQVVCSAGSTTAFSGGTQTACGCGANLKRVKQQTGSRVHTVQTTDGAVTTDSYSAYSYTFQDMSACGALITTTATEITETEDNRCQGTSNTTFSAGSASNAGGQTACGCTGSNRRNILRTLKYDRTVTQYDGVTVSTTNGAIKSQTFSNLTACGTSHASIAASAANSSPQPVGYPVVSNSGATVTLASSSTPLSPNPQTNEPVAPGPTTTTTGSALTIALAPNPQFAAGSPTTTTTLGGFPDTLADVAMYYFRSDLRGGTDIKGNTTGPSTNLGGTGTTDVAANVVPARPGAKDFVTHQHMTTFTVGLADGLMRYQSDYETAATGDVANIRNGTNGACFWITGTCDWPQPVADDASALDDLWHAAVNGRGQFYLATNADALATGIQTALTALNAQIAAAAASATSSPNITQTNNQIFSTTYETNTWSGQVFAQKIDPVTFQVSTTIDWRAETQLLSKIAASSDTRTIWTFDSSSGTKLKSFTWASLTAAEQAFFLNKCVPASTMTQCTSLTAGQLAIANDGSSLLGFLRGQIGNETTVFRDRQYVDVANNNTIVQTVLGDTVNAKPSYVREPVFNYADAVTPAYSTFLAANANRSPRVYVAANDGYLHAFHGDTGEEMWAYLPRFLMPGLYQLADSGYATLHRYYADGSPEVGDVFDSTASAWKTILVAGAGAGGRGYYALDITDPANPKGLWELCSDATLCALTDSDLGLGYSSPIIGKRKSDGRWVVVITSGLNNTSTGTGLGYFYVLDALTGATLDKVATTAGTIGTPSGLMKAAAFYDSALTDATFQYVYAGDQLGNVWRLDMGTSTSAGSCAAPALASTVPPCVTHVATLTDGSSPPRAQPITTRPSLTHIGTSRIMYFGTGRYLGAPDLADPGAASGIAWQQTLYGFKDKDADYGNLRADTNMVRQQLTQISPTERGIAGSPNPPTVNWSTQDGWYLDFNPTFGGVPNSPGEGVSLVEPTLVLGTLIVTTNAPAAGGSSCSVGGSSFQYALDFRTGAPVATSAGGVVGKALGAFIVGVAIVQSDSGIGVINTDVTGGKTPDRPPVAPPATPVRRFSYRIR